MSPVTTDGFLNGRLTILQKSDGYRFSVDAVILANSIDPKSGESVLDLGTGCGIIPLILSYRNPGATITGVEVQPALAGLAKKNVRFNQMQDRIEIVQADMRQMVLPPERNGFDWVICNPPYRKPLSGRLNPNTEKALARHEIKVDLEQLVATVRKMLYTGGRFVTIYPAERLSDLICQMRGYGIEPKKIRCIHSKYGQNAKLILVHGIKGGRPGVTIEPPLSVYNENGGYTREIEAMMMP